MWDKEKYNRKKNLWLFNNQIKNDIQHKRKIIFITKQENLTKIYIETEKLFKETFYLRKG